MILDAILMKKIIIFSLLVVFSTSLGMERDLLKDITYAQIIDKNERSYNEDETTCYCHENKGHFFAVYDGHNGGGVSDILKNECHIKFFEVLNKDNISAEQAFEKTFLTMDHYVRHVRKYTKSGTTAVIVYIDENNYLHIAHAGDSRCVVSIGDRCGFYATQDHKPNREDEKERIINNGGSVNFYDKAWRVNYGLAISRTIGDNNKRDGDKEKQIISTPEYKCLKIDSTMNFIILASDGLWDEITNEFAVDFVKQGLKDGKVLDTIAKELTAEAIKKGSTDNISVVIVKFV